MCPLRSKAGDSQSRRRRICSDHPSIRQVVTIMLPETRRQQCAVHFEHNTLAHMLQSERKVMAEDFKKIFSVKRRNTAESLA